MLRSLTIRNYALIEYVDLEFGPGLTIITGETGAGKSIMLGALSLVMGGRADMKVISDGSSKSVVEAVFIDVDPALRSVLEEKGIDWIAGEDGKTELNVRRELSASGRSKIYINDTSVTLQTLSMIVPRLIDIHSQHANAKINDAAERLMIIDAMAKNDSLRREYRELFGRYVELRRNIKSLKEAIDESHRNIDFIRFQVEQLEKLKPKKGELKEIEARFELLSDADEIKERLQNLSTLLGDPERSVLALLGEASSIAGKIDFSLFKKTRQKERDPNDDDNDTVVNRLKSLIVETKDIFETIDDMNSGMESNPAELSRLSQRMNLYYDTLKRFKLDDADLLVELYADLRKQLSDATEGDDRLPKLETEAKSVAAELRLKADRLSENRTKSAEKFSLLLNKVARPLGLPNINFEARVEKSKLTSTGQDEIEFLCSFNKNGQPRNISEIASGGEISRMMLSLKSILAGHVNLPTIIFDEVDTGVSGEIAFRMGEMMHDVASSMQVIAITHLPQVAAKGDEHFKVFKRDADSKTVTSVERLDDDGRIRELAAMISGSTVTEASLNAARQLLDEN